MPWLWTQRTSVPRPSTGIMTFCRFKISRRACFSPSVDIHLDVIIADHRFPDILAIPGQHNRLSYR
jgi:hypothetical protein